MPASCRCLVLRLCPRLLWLDSAAVQDTGSRQDTGTRSVCRRRCAASGSRPTPAPGSLVPRPTPKQGSQVPKPTPTPNSLEPKPASAPGSLVRRPAPAPRRAPGERRSPRLPRRERCRFAVWPAARDSAPGPPAPDLAARHLPGAPVRLPSPPPPPPHPVVHSASSAPSPTHGPRARMPLY